MRVLTVLLLFSSVVAAQEGAKAPKGPADVEIGDPGVAIKDAAIAKRRVAQFREKMKAAADDAAGLGSAEVWRRLGTIHHITTVVEELGALPWP